MGLSATLKWLPYPCIAGTAPGGSVACDPGEVPAPAQSGTPLQACIKCTQTPPDPSSGWTLRGWSGTCVELFATEQIEQANAIAKEESEADPDPCGTGCIAGIVAAAVTACLGSVAGAAYAKSANACCFKEGGGASVMPTAHTTDQGGAFSSATPAHPPASARLPYPPATTTSYSVQVAPYPPAYPTTTSY